MTLSRYPASSVKLALCVKSLRVSLAEGLERRLLFSAFTVTNAADSGPGSLRVAIDGANAVSGASTVSFDIPGTGIQTIALLSPLPVIAHQLVIDGTTQPGYSSFFPNPMVQLDGATAGRGASGLVFGGDSARSTVKALAIAHFGHDGIVLQGSNDSVRGCYVGLDATGATAANNGGNGIVVVGSSDTIGGTTAADGNVIAANGLAGIEDEGPALVVTGNRIGIGGTATGMGNGHEGIVATLGAIIGGAGPARNVISGNGYSGILVVPEAQVQVLGNYIGADANGMTAVPNGTSVTAPWGDGITVFGDASIGLPTGGSAPIGNIISGNAGAGISVRPKPAASTNSTTVIAGNFIGTDARGAAAVANGGDGIDIAAGGVRVGNPLSNAGPGFVSNGNLISGNRRDGVLITSATGVRIGGNYIGCDLTGMHAIPNGGNGIEAVDAHACVIGGPEVLRNVISSNHAAGISLRASPGSSPRKDGNLIVNNFIGANSGPAGEAGPDGNDGNGIEILESNDTIGGTAGQDNANRISGNRGSGIYIGGGVDSFKGLGPPTGNFVGSNSIVGNLGDGITLDGALGTTIGGAGAGNSISFNQGNGVTVFSRFGHADPTGTNNLVSQNQIGGNRQLPIDLGGDGVTPNDHGDADTGPNQLQNYPVLLSAAGSRTGTAVRFLLDTKPGTYVLEFFAQNAPTPVPISLDLRFVEAVTVTVSSGPDQIFTVQLPPIPLGQLISATATDSVKNTSEFSAAEVVTPQPPPPPEIAGVVGFSDLLVLAQNYGKTAASPAADWNGDGVVDFADLLLLSQSYGRRRGGS